jgi:hypothetical protein
MAILYPYGPKLARLLANPPRRGENRHTWIYRVAISLKRQGADLDDVQRRLEGLAREWGWFDRLRDIAHAVARLKNPDAKPGGPAVWMPARNEDARAAALTASPRFAFRPAGLAADDVLPRLFGPDDLVCVAAQEYSPTTQRLADVLPAADRMQYIVANPMRAPHGLSRQGRPGPRTLDNACLPDDRRYIVIEFDTGDAPEAQIRLLSALHTMEASLTLAVFSGGKSIHGWFNVAGLRPSDKLRAFRRGVLLGCDASLWDPSKLVRMPGGLRASGVHQEILHWEPEHAA